MKRVVVTGIGAVTPLADNFNDSWLSVLNGVSGIKQISKFDSSNLKWKMAGEVLKFDPLTCLSKKEVIKLDAFIHYAVAAAIMASCDAGLQNESSKLASAGVIIGSSRGGIGLIEKAAVKLSGSRPKLSSYLMAATTISMAASYIAQKLNMQGNCLGISNACASGANAIGEAFRLIRHGYSKIVFAGGAEAPVCRLCIEGYGVSGALSNANDASASKPFDIKRDGFVIAEGSCVLVLEEYESALKRNANIYGEIIGYSNKTDAFHVTKPSLQGQAGAMLEAINDAGIKPGDIHYINAHGTSTLIGDKTEAEAVNIVFTEQIPASSIKSMTGHMLAASGAFEAACTLMSLRQGIIPKSINLTEKDPECNINVITEKKKADINVAISNSFGFGGVNAVLILKRVK